MLNEEFNYYQANSNSLDRKYDGNFIVIVGNEVIGSYPNHLTAIVATLQSHTPGTFLVQYCSTSQARNYLLQAYNLSKGHPASQSAPRAFTVRYKHLASEIDIPLKIDISFIFPGLNHKPINVMSIWDTGATHTLISASLARKHGFPPTGRANVGSVNHTDEVETFTLDVGLPNRIVLRCLPVASGDPPGCELLIGMDIIGFGDFAVTQVNGKTVVSFRMPAANKEIDFVTDIQDAKQREQMKGTNRKARRKLKNKRRKK